jgi:hypothetical protein
MSHLTPAATGGTAGSSTRKTTAAWHCTAPSLVPAGQSSTPHPTSIARPFVQAAVLAAPMCEALPAGHGAQLAAATPASA